jgi:hypothetical protein
MSANDAPENFTPPQSAVMSANKREEEQLRHHLEEAERLARRSNNRTIVAGISEARLLIESELE